MRFLVARDQNRNIPLFGGNWKVGQIQSIRDCKYRSIDLACRNNRVGHLLTYTNSCGPPAKESITRIFGKRMAEALNKVNDRFSAKFRHCQPIQSGKEKGIRLARIPLV